MNVVPQYSKVVHIKIKLSNPTILTYFQKAWNMYLKPHPHFRMNL